MCLHDYLLVNSGLNLWGDIAHSAVHIPHCAWWHYFPPLTQPCDPFSAFLQNSQAWAATHVLHPSKAHQVARHLGMEYACYGNDWAALNGERKHERYLLDREKKAHTSQRLSSLSIVGLLIWRDWGLRVTINTKANLVQLVYGFYIPCLQIQLYYQNERKKVTYWAESSSYQVRWKQVSV